MKTPESISSYAVKYCDIILEIMKEFNKDELKLKIPYAPIINHN